MLTISHNVMYLLGVKVYPPVPKCPLCAGSKYLTSFQRQDDRYFVQGVFTYLCCKFCHSYFLAEDVDSLKKLYEENYRTNMSNFESVNPLVQPRVYDPHFYVNRPNSNVLEIGCGDGQLLKAISLNQSVFGVEIDPKHSLSLDFLGLPYQIGNFLDLNFAENRFDYILLSQVIEHFPDIEKLMLACNLALTDQGKIIFSTPNPQSLNARIFKRFWIHWHAPYHAVLLSKEGINFMARRFGYHVELLKTRTNPKWFNYQLIIWSLYKNGSSPQSFWVGKKSYLSPICRLLIKTRMLLLINWTLDLFGLGDNYICILSKESANF